LHCFAPSLVKGCTMANLVDNDRWWSKVAVEHHQWK